MIIRRGGKAPPWFLDQPDLEYGDDFWLDAFYNLSTCRSHGMNVGPIPWTAMREYSVHYELGDELSEDFFVIIKSLDNVYLNWYNKQANKS